MNPSLSKARALTATAIVLGAAALLFIACRVIPYRDDLTGFLHNRTELLMLLGALIALMIALRLNSQAAKIRMVLSVKAPAETPNTELNPRLRVYEGRPQAAEPADPDFETQLRKLYDLKESGVLTQEEFDAKKAEILHKVK